MTILYIILASVLSGLAYRMGGSDKYNTKWRDVGCPLVALTLVALLAGLNPAYWWAYLLFFGMSWGMLTTYWDEFFGYDNYYAHGFMCALAGLWLLPVVAWYWIVIRIVICTLGMEWWSKIQTNDVKEEFGRGVFFIL